MKKMATHIKVWLAAASLHEQSISAFSPAQLEREVERLFGERSTTIKTFISAHVNASAPRNNPVVYNYTIRTSTGQARLCRLDDPVHPSRAGASRWPDQDAVEEQYWPLWRKWSTWQQNPDAEQVAAAVELAPPPARAREDDVDSTYRAAFLEQLLISDLMRHLWPRPLVVYRPQMETAGTDRIFVCQGVVRHVHLVVEPPRVDRGSEQRQGSYTVWLRLNEANLQAEYGWIRQRTATAAELAQYLFGLPGARAEAREEDGPARLAAYIRRLVGFRLERSPAGNYNHMGATIAEVILQAGIDYRSVVVPRVQKILQRYPEAITTSGFLALLERMGPEEVLDFRGEKPQRVHALTLFLSSEGIETEDQLRRWLQDPANQIRLRSVPGVGPKTVDYMQILVGISTSAVDRHLAQFVADAGIVAQTYEARQRVIREAAALLGVEEAVLDYSIWLYMSDRSR